MKKYLLALTMAISSDATMTLNGQCYIANQVYNEITLNGQCTIDNVDANYFHMNGSNSLRNSHLSTVESSGFVDIFCTKIHDIEHTGKIKIKESSIDKMHLYSKSINHITNCDIDLLIITLEKPGCTTEVHIKESNIGEVRYNKDDNIKVIYH